MIIDCTIFGPLNELGGTTQVRPTSVANATSWARQLLVLELALLSGVLFLSAGWWLDGLKWLFVSPNIHPALFANPYQGKKVNTWG
jgi:hypothetical protein